MKSILQSAVNLARGEPIRDAHLPSHISASLQECAEEAGSPVPSPVKPLAEVEKVHILDVYRQTGNNKSKTARLLGIGLEHAETQADAV